MIKTLFLFILSLFFTAISFAANVEIDYMEYATPALAQAAYVTDGGDTINQSQVVHSNDTVLGDANDLEERRAQGFQLSGSSLFVTAVTIRQGPSVGGTPTGNWTLRIETDNAGVPSGTLANANASVVVSPPGIDTDVKGTFATPFSLSSGTQYHLVILCDNQSTNNYWALDFQNSNVYANGAASRSTNGGSSWTAQAWDMYFIVYVKDLQSYSESTIKTQGSYSLKAVAAQTDSLNDTLTKNLLVSNADIDDEDMADISDWADGDTGTGESSQVTFDGKSCMKLDTGANTGGYAYRTEDVGTFDSRTVLSMNVYCETLGNHVNGDTLYFIAYNGSHRLMVTFNSDGLFDGNADTEMGTSLVTLDTWQEWTFDVDWITQKVDIYLDKVLVLEDQVCFDTSATANGTIGCYVGGVTTANQIAYIDWFKAGNALNTIDLSDQETLKLDVRSDRTGENLQVIFHNDNDEEITHNIDIDTADTYQTESIDISDVANADKDAIDSIIVTLINADAENTFYIDNMYADSANRRIIMIQ